MKMELNKEGIMTNQAGIRSRNLFDPKATQPFRLSRSKLELFTQCPRCFYLDRRLGINRPSMPPFTLNSAVDTLLKKEFDIHRAKNKAHPLMEFYGIDATPYNHPDLDVWRNTFKGLETLHRPTNLLIFGAIDDIWQAPNDDLIIVDYKSTSTLKKIDLNDQWKQAYKRQMEIYQWIARQMGMKVSNTGYFVYANCDTDRKAFDAKLEFDLSILPYQGDDGWVEATITAAHQALIHDLAPSPNQLCEYCVFIDNASQVTIDQTPGSTSIQKQLF